MRSEFTFNSVVRCWCLALAVIFYCLIWAACQTNPSAQFSKIKVSMTKDDVLESVGSPQRTERINGKEKWAYHLYHGSNPTTESFWQVTFLNGHVVSAGEDFDEIRRLNEIAISDEHNEKAQRDYKQKQIANAKLPKVQSKEEFEEEPRRETEDDFVEMKGQHAPIKKVDSDD